MKTIKPRIVSTHLTERRVNIVFISGKKRGQGACENAEAAEEPTALREAFDPLSGQSLSMEGNASLHPVARWCAPSRQMVWAAWDIHTMASPLKAHACGNNSTI